MRLLLVLQAFTFLEQALTDQYNIEARIASGKTLLADMLKSRKEAADASSTAAKPPAAAAADEAAANGAAAASPSSPPPAADGNGTPDGAAAAKAPAASSTSSDEVPPDEVIAIMLKRESLLTRARLHVLQHEIQVAEKQSRSIRAQIRLVSATRFRDIGWCQAEIQFFNANSMHATHGAARCIFVLQVCSAKH